VSSLNHTRRSLKERTLIGSRQVIRPAQCEVKERGCKNKNAAN